VLELHPLSILAALTLLMAACAPASAPPASSGGPAAAPAPGAGRTLVLAMRIEPPMLVSRPFTPPGQVIATAHNLVNGTLAKLDEAGFPQPHLAEMLPRLGASSWQVGPDGRMTTTYRLRPNLTWHDGAALTAADFVFSWRIYSTPALGVASSTPFGLMEEVAAPDERTVSISWRRLYPDAGALALDFPPLPRHILESSFTPETLDTFTSLPYWRPEFVGAGPYRLERYEPGTFFEVAAFEQHALGRPKIDRVTMRFIVDENTALANLLSGEIHAGVDATIGFPESLVVRREWEGRSGGTVIMAGTNLQAVYPQFRPEYLGTRALSDLRVRKALAHTIDKQALNQALFEGEWTTQDTLIPPTIHYFQEAERQASRYPFDLRRAEQLLAEAGYARGADAIWTGPDGRLRFEHKVNAGTSNVSEGSLLSGGWRQAGFEVDEVVLPMAQINDGQVRGSFPGVFTFTSTGLEAGIGYFTSSQISRPENRWTGNNRGGWSEPEFDRLWDMFTTTLPRDERDQLAVRMAKQISDELPAMVLYFRPRVCAYVAALKGPERVAPDGSISWNIWQWEWRS
jgi:peptide/nickel transport system substrate-binding protein